MAQKFILTLFLLMLLFIYVSADGGSESFSTVSNFLYKSTTQTKVFDVRNYGAKADVTDNSNALLRTWNDACQWVGKATVLIPLGKYNVSNATMVGPCKGSIVFLMRGDLIAPNNSSLFLDTNQWISFRNIDGLNVTGGGTLDGQGASAWPFNDCKKDPNCKDLPDSMTFFSVTNSTIDHIKSINSKKIHFKLYGCENINVSNVDISAPGDSPNTDGINIGSSSNIKISHLIIGTGDDCIPIVSGNTNINISDVFCGPGHGISIGSLGKPNQNEENVMEIFVKNCTISNTTNGVRIKTWASPVASIASNFTHEDIFMVNVINPIIIDQQYCPRSPCDQQTHSRVQIKDVTFGNIWGTCSSKVAVTFNCSESFPCNNLVLRDINLTYHGSDGPAISSCSHANVLYSGIEIPPPCP